MQLSCAIITLQIFWAKQGRAYSEGGRVERGNEWGGRRREGEARAKPGNQLVKYIRRCHRIIVIAEVHLQPSRFPRVISIRWATLITGMTNIS